MLGTYWQRARRIAQTIKEIGQKSVREIANAAGVSRSAAPRHLQAFTRRNKHPESHLLPSMAGQIWLVRLVVATIFHFGIKRGAETISDFFRTIRIDTHVGCSKSSVRTMRQQIEELIIEYGAKYQEEAAKKSGTLQIVGGVDETFFNDIMVLVMLDLSTGYMLCEEVASNRTYDTWKEKIEAALGKMKIKVRFLVSDRAKALIKLATEYFECQSIADLFHAVHKISQTFTLALHNKLNATTQELEKLEQKYEKVPAEEVETRHSLENLRKKLQEKQQELQQVLRKYRELLHSFSFVVHPFDVKNDEIQSSIKVEQTLNSIITELEKLAKRMELNYPKLQTVKNQLPDIARLMDIWWDWVNQSLNEITLEADVLKWAKEKLLPLVYWRIQLSKTSNPNLKATYKEAYERARRRFIEDPLTQQLSLELRLRLEKWAESPPFWAPSGAQKGGGAKILSS